MNSKNGILKIRSSLLPSFFTYGLIQLTQWISYAAIFKILLQDKHNSGLLIPIYIGVLALVRAVCSVMLGRRWLIDNRDLFKIILISAIFLTGIQQLLIYSGLIQAFMFVTAIKLGSL